MKKQIGFCNVNETKVKDTPDSRDESDNMPAKIPQNVMNEIEEHIIAKHEYEKSMRLIYRAKQIFYTILILCALGVYGVMWYCGYRYGCKKTEVRIKEHYKLIQTMKNIYSEGYHVGFKDAKINKAAIPDKHYKVK